ncbi:hypothetical protein IW261DRAFT_1569861 [Armillaria novae-zelandiae]|uniref:Uncharacterized protein n=1 Tax=Armillaria novae-zelandiae TaxID=153914 RepID=A0AA39UCA1_9AGAR|nr:hypothetical protein IW261DRAFT_1569861 [Armillaria novae-zelandiae]
MYYQVVPFALKKGVKIPARALLGVTRNSSSVHDNDPVMCYRKRKAEEPVEEQVSDRPLLSTAQEGWNEFLATDSEVSVKADRDNRVSSDRPPGEDGYAYSQVPANLKRWKFPEKTSSGKEGLPK